MADNDDVLKALKMMYHNYEYGEGLSYDNRQFVEKVMEKYKPDPKIQEDMQRRVWELISIAQANLKEAKKLSDEYHVSFTFNITDLSIYASYDGITGWSSSNQNC